MTTNDAIIKKVKEYAPDIADGKGDTADRVAVFLRRHINQERIVKQIGAEEADGGDNVHQRGPLPAALVDEAQQSHADDADRAEHAEKNGTQAAGLGDAREYGRHQRDEDARNPERQPVARGFQVFRERARPVILEKNRKKHRH